MSSPTDHAVEQFSDFLRLKDEPQGERALVLAVRKSMVQKLCRYYGVERISELKDDAIPIALAAFGLKPIPSHETNVVEGLKAMRAHRADLHTKRLRAEMEAMRAHRADLHTKRLRAEMEANDVGQLWTGMASLDRGKAFIVVWQGYLDDPEVIEGFHVQHANAGMFLDPHTFIGDKQSMRKHFIGLFNTADIHLRTIEKE